MKNFIKLCIVCVIMMMGIASCGAPSSYNGAQTNTKSKEFPKNLIKEGEITDVEQVHKHVDGFCIQFIAFTYNGHRYIKYNRTSDVLLHAPDCPCFRTSSNTSSSLWDW